MAQILEGLKNIITFIGHVISFPVKILQLVYGWDFGAIAESAIWWLPVTAVASLVSILALSVIFRVFSK